MIIYTVKSKGTYGTTGTPSAIKSNKDLIAAADLRFSEIDFMYNPPTIDTLMMIKKAKTT